MATLNKVARVVAAALVGLGISAGAQAAAFITNGPITMGVLDLGNLGTGSGTGVYPGPSTGGVGVVGLRYAGPAGSYASTEPGCVCEGWGAALASTGATGFANVAGGTAGLSLVSFTSTASTATSVTRIGTTMEVTHFYHASASPNLVVDDVSIKNISGSAFASGDLRYRRVMDWDIEPTAFSEFVTIAGVPALLGIANGTNLLHTSDDGFKTANPLGGTSGIGCATDANFTKCGPADHGALFDFQFEALADGATRTFSTVYGAAGNEKDIMTALTTVGAGIYSLGYSTTRDALGIRIPNTESPVFAFGFLSTGGVLDPVDPNPIPEPGSMALIGIALAGLAASRRRKTA